MDEILQVRNVTKSFHKRPVLKGVDLTVEKGDFLVLFGRHSSGKSTLLRAVMGLDSVDGGEMLLRGRSVANVGPGERNIGYVPQSFALFPEKTIFENIAYPLSFGNEDRHTARTRVAEMAAMLHIDHLLDKLPTQASGGEKQRVAIARGLVKRSEIYILDDPLAGLDFKLREQLVDDLRDLHRSIEATILYATSDSLEALLLARTLAVIEKGEIVQRGDPKEIYRMPRTLTTASILGYPEANILRGTLRRDPSSRGARVDAGWIRIGLEPANGVVPDCDAVALAIRPEAIRLEREDAGSGTSGARIILPGRIALTEDLGGEMIVHVELESETIRVVVRHDEAEAAMDARRMVVIPPEEIMVFDAATETYIGRGKGLGNA